jgi:tetratricopeptide (TPR) repeat protein
VSLVPLVPLANVHEHGRLGCVEALARLLDLDLSDSRLHAPENSRAHAVCGYRRRAVSPRTRIVALVAAAALLAVVVTLGVTVLSTEDDDEGATVADIRSGNPPLVLDLGVRADSEAGALRRGQRLYSRGAEKRAARVFARFSSPQARIGQAFAAWPDGTVSRLERLRTEHPRSAVVQLHVGLARFWAGRNEEAFDAWRAAVRAEPDTASAVRANDLLHPDSPPGLPFFVPEFAAPERLESLSPPAQLRALERAARGDDVRAKLLYGLALQRLGRPVSAERQFAAAAALAPRNVDARVAAAVARYRKDAPQRAFSRLGPLARTFPKAATVRFHLGLLLIWLGRADDAKRQLELARGLEPGSLYARESSRLLRGLEKRRR